jgi:hypothetical protein
MKKLIPTIAIIIVLSLTIAGTKRTTLMLDNTTGVTTQTADFTSGNLKIGGTATQAFTASDAANVSNNTAHSVSTANPHGVTASQVSALAISNNLSDVNNVSTARTNLGLGTAAILNTGTAANNVVQLDSSAKLPAVDGSQLTNLPSASGGKLIIEDSGYGLDNVSSGRGTAGIKSVSLEYSTTGTTFGATGNYSFAGGFNSTASGEYSISFGRSTTASGDSSFSSGYMTLASGSYSFACCSTTIATGNYSFAGGFDTESNGLYSFSYGRETLADGFASFSNGYNAKASNYCEFSHSSGIFANNGDCQSGKLQARKQTSTTSLTELFLDGNSCRFTLLDGDAYSCRITVLGKQADGSCGTAVYQVLIKNEGGTTSLTGNMQTIVAWFGDTNIGTPTWSISADDTNDALSIKIIPANTTSTRWTAVIEHVKINY